MADKEFIITYDGIDNIRFPNAAGMRAYLTKEAKIWAPFLETLQDRDFLRNVSVDKGARQVSRDQLVKVFDTLINLLDLSLIHISEPTRPY